MSDNHLDSLDPEAREAVRALIGAADTLMEALVASGYTAEWARSQMIDAFELCRKDLKAGRRALDHLIYMTRGKAPKDRVLDNFRTVFVAGALRALRDQFGMSHRDSRVELGKALMRAFEEDAESETTTGPRN